MLSFQCFLIKFFLSEIQLWRNMHFCCSLSVWNAVVYFVAICTIVLFNYDHMIAISFNGCAALEVYLCIHRSCFLWITLHTSNAIRSICSPAKVTSNPNYTCIYNIGIVQCVRFSSPGDESQFCKDVRVSSKPSPALCTAFWYVFVRFYEPWKKK